MNSSSATQGLVNQSEVGHLPLASAPSQARVKSTPATSASTGEIPTVSIMGTPPGKPRRVKSLSELARDIVAALRRSPYFVVVSGFPPIDNRTHLLNLARSIHRSIQAGQWEQFQTQQSQNILLAQPPLLAAEEVSFTQVRIAPDKVNQRGESTRYSRTHLALPPHTDSSYSPLPHELVAFQCLAADEIGGESIMVPVSEVVKHLDKETQARLREPVYPFGQGNQAILAGQGEESRMRYYQAQVERSRELSPNPPLTDAHQAALKTLDGVLAKLDSQYRFQLQPGQIVFMHNQRVLHGRTALSPESDRLLYRVRLHLPGLDIPDLSASEFSAPELSASEPKACPLTAATLASRKDLLGMARELEEVDRWNDALCYLHQVLAQDPDRVEALNAYGSLLLHIGAFDSALSSFQRSVALDPDDYDSRLSLSSLQHELGNPLEARAQLREVTRCYPYILEEEVDLQKPTILRLRGFGGAHYGILQRASGTCRKLLRGGHFATTDLINDSNYNVALLNIFENNSDDIDDIPEFDLILNTIACPDSKRASLLAAARFCDRYPHIPVINPPRKVLETTRERNSIRLNTLPGVLFPKTERIFREGLSVEDTVRQIQGLGFEFPLIVRQAGTQTGQTVALLSSESELREHVAANPTDSDYYVIQYVDCRCRRNPIFHKMRMFFINGTPYPVANVFRDAWNIHSGDRYDVMDQTPWMQDEERAYLGDPVGYLGAENFNHLRKIETLIGLDFFGLDFTILRDGRLLIFELNAAMRHNFDHAGNFPYTRPYLTYISEAFEAMVHSRIQQ